MENRMSPVSRDIIGERFNEIHDLALRLAGKLEELKRIELPFADEVFIEDFYSTANLLQSDISDFIQDEKLQDVLDILNNKNTIGYEVGNHVYYNSDKIVCTIRKITRFTYELDDNNRGQNAGYEDLSPIPISSDLLLKIGFVEKEGILKYNNLAIKPGEHEPQKKWEMFYGKKAIGSYNYLHQIQNIQALLSTINLPKQLSLELDILKKGHAKNEIKSSLTSPSNALNQDKSKILNGFRRKK